MTRNLFIKFMFILFILTIIACAGLNLSQLAPRNGLRFSQLSPDAKNFHPQRVAVFPIAIWNHKEYSDSRGVVEQIVAGSLVEKKWFADIMDTESLNKQIEANEELRKIMTDYLSKLRMLTFSDSDLSRQIGELTKIDAFLLVSVDDWEYTVVNEKKLAKVGLTMELYDVSTGKLMWKAGHAISEEYLFIEPELPKIAHDVALKMITYMPH